MPTPRRSRAELTDELIFVGATVTRWTERLLEGHEPKLTLAQYLALKAIDAEQLGGSELARRTGVSGPSVSQLLASLVDAGLLDRRPLDADRRRLTLELSQQGKSALRSAESLVRARLDSLLGDLPKHEREELTALLARAGAVLSGEPPPRRPPPGHGPEHGPAKHGPKHKPPPKHGPKDKPR